MSRYFDTLLQNYHNLEDFLGTVRTFLQYNDTTKTHPSLNDLNKAAAEFIESTKPVGFWGEKTKNIESAVIAHVLAQNLDSQPLPVGFEYLKPLIERVADLDEDIDTAEFHYELISKAWSDVRHFRASLQYRIANTEE